MQSPDLRIFFSLHSSLQTRHKSAPTVDFVSLQRRQSRHFHHRFLLHGYKVRSTSSDLLTAAAVSIRRSDDRLSSLSGRAPLVRVRVGNVVLEGFVHEEMQRGMNSLDNEEDFATVLEILKREDKFRYHKVPQLKALKLKLKPALVLCVLKNKEVKPSNAWKFFVWAKKQMGYKHSGEVYNTIIVKLLEIRKFTSIYYLLEDMYKDGVSLTSETCVRMAKTFGSAGMVDRAVHALNHMTRLGKPATTRHLNSLVTELLKSQHHYKAYIAYREMAKTGCEPDSHTFKLLLRDLARVEKMELASHIFDDMQARGCEPDAETGSIVVCILCQSGRAGDAVVVFEKLKQQGIKLNAKVYINLLKGLVETSNVEKALKIFDEMHIHGHRPESSASAALLDLLAASGRDEDAERWREYISAYSFSMAMERCDKG